MILESIIPKDKENFKCFDLIKTLLNENEEFRTNVETLIHEGKLRGFDEELWQKIESQNIRRINSFTDVFREGANIGYCTVASKQLSYSFDDCYICGGTLPILVGTKNSPDGRHTWLVHNKEIIDTSLMIIMDEKSSSVLGYIEENRYNPNMDSTYLAAKEFTNDESLRR